MDTLLLHALVAALLALYAGFTVLGAAITGQGWRWFFWLPANAAYSVPLLALPGMLWAYRKRSAMTLSLYVPVLAWWVLMQPFAWRLQGPSFAYSLLTCAFIGGVGAMLLVLAECHAEESPLATPYRFFGASMIGGLLIPLSYGSLHGGHGLDALGELVELPVGVLVEVVSVLIAPALVALATGAIARRTARLERGEEVSLLGASFVEASRLWVPLGFALLTAVLACYELFVGEPWVPTILVNAAMFVLALWLMQGGLREGRGRRYAAGVLYFLLWVVLRYVDLFGDFGGMLGASGMFFLCGAMLFGLATFWRRRRKVVRHV